MNCQFCIRSAAAGIFLIASLITGGCSNDDTRPSAEPEADTYDFTMLRGGDIIVKRGKGMLSQRIVDHLNEPIPFSHCAVVTAGTDSLYIIHSVARELTGVDGVQTVGFKQFMKDVVRGYFYVVRLKDTTVASASLDAAAKRFAARRVPFDYSLDQKDSTAMNCSEMVFWVLKNTTGRDLFNRIPVNKSQALAFNSLLDTANFEIVCRY